MVRAGWALRARRANSDVDGLPPGVLAPRAFRRLSSARSRAAIKGGENCAAALHPAQILPLADAMLKLYVLLAIAAIALARPQFPGPVVQTTVIRQPGFGSGFNSGFGSGGFNNGGFGRPFNGGFNNGFNRGPGGFGSGFNNGFPGGSTTIIKKTFVQPFGK